MKTYKIRDGFSFRRDDGTIIGGGETIDLAEDVAAQNLHKLEDVGAADAAPAAPAVTPAVPEGAGHEDEQAQ